jgi:hypothetical protein
MYVVCRELCVMYVVCGVASLYCMWYLVWVAYNI